MKKRLAGSIFWIWRELAIIELEIWYILHFKFCGLRKFFQQYRWIVRLIITRCFCGNYLVYVKCIHSDTSILDKSVQKAKHILTLYTLILSPQPYCSQTNSQGSDIINKLLKRLHTTTIKQCSFVEKMGGGGHIIILQYLHK